MRMPHSLATAATLVCAFALTGCHRDHDDFIKRCEEMKQELIAQKPEHERRFAENGFDIVALQEANARTARYTLKKNPDNGLTYEGDIDREGSISDLKALEVPLLLLKP